MARGLKRDLEALGHEVWFDEDRLIVGADWETRIERGLEWAASEAGSGRVVLLMTPHSVRRPDGYCLNELARAISRGLSIVPVMVVWAEAPLSLNGSTYGTACPWAASPRPTKESSRCLRQRSSTIISISKVRKQG